MELLTGTKHLRAAIRRVANVLNPIDSFIHLVRGSDELALLVLEKRCACGKQVRLWMGKRVRVPMSIYKSLYY